MFFAVRLPKQLENITSSWKSIWFKYTCGSWMLFRFIFIFIFMCLLNGLNEITKRHATTMFMINQLSVITWGFFFLLQIFISKSIKEMRKEFKGESQPNEMLNMCVFQRMKNVCRRFCCCCNGPQFFVSNFIWSRCSWSMCKSVGMRKYNDEHEIDLLKLLGSTSL